MPSLSFLVRCSSRKGSPGRARIAVIDQACPLIGDGRSPRRPRRSAAIAVHDNGPQSPHPGHVPPPDDARHPRGNRPRMIRHRSALALPPAYWLALALPATPPPIDRPSHSQPELRKAMLLCIFIISSACRHPPIRTPAPMKRCSAKEVQPRAPHHLSLAEQSMWHRHAACRVSPMTEHASTCRKRVNRCWQTYATAQACRASYEAAIGMMML